MSRSDRSRGNPYLRHGSSNYQITVAGVRRTSGTADYEKAKKLQEHLNSQAWLQEQFGIKTPKSWEELCVRWGKEKGHKITFDSLDLLIIEWWTPFLGQITDVRKITREMVDGIILQNRPVTPDTPSSANNTANHYVGIVGSMLNAACREWDWTDKAPRLRRYPILRGRERYLSLDEWRLLERELPWHLRWAASFALATGLRADKVFSLEWRQIDLKERRLTFVGTDNKQGNTIPLNETALSVLREIQAAKVRHMTRVFFYAHPFGENAGVPVPLNDYGDAWHKAMQRAGFGSFVKKRQWVGDGMTFHGLRHTFATWLGERGVPEGIIDRLGGWKVNKKHTRERYTHLNMENLRQYSAVIDHVLAGRDVRFLVQAVASEVHAGANSRTDPLAIVQAS